MLMHQEDWLSGMEKYTECTSQWQTKQNSFYIAIAYNPFLPPEFIIYFGNVSAKNIVKEANF